MKKKVIINNKKGYTLIELMIVLAIIFLSTGYLIRGYINFQLLAGTEVALQRAMMALHTETEILRKASWEELSRKEVFPFDARVKELDRLVAGRGVVKVVKDLEHRELLTIRVEVHWRDERRGMRSMHTVLFKSPES